MDILRFRYLCINAINNMKLKFDSRELFVETVNVFTQEPDTYEFKNVHSDSDIEEKLKELISGGIFNMTKFQYDKILSILVDSFNCL